MICIPKDHGGLGNLNLKIQNMALLTKQLHKFYNQADVPWVNLIWQAYYANNEVPHACKNRGSFWWRDILNLFDIYRNMAICNISRGTPLYYGMTYGIIILHQINSLSYNLLHWTPRYLFTRPNNWTHTTTCSNYLCL